MPALSQLKAITASATVDFYGVAVAVKYFPGAVTIRLEGDMFNSPEGETSLERADRIASAFLQIVADWDVTDEHDNRVPVSAESIREIPADVLWDVLRQIRDRDSIAKNGGGQ